MLTLNLITGFANIEPESEQNLPFLPPGWTFRETESAAKYRNFGGIIRDIYQTLYLPVSERHIYLVLEKVCCLKHWSGRTPYGLLYPCVEVSKNKNSMNVARGVSGERQDVRYSRTANDHI